MIPNFNDIIFFPSLSLSVCLSVSVCLSLSLSLSVSPFLYPSHLAPTFFFILYNSFHYSRMFRSPSSNIPALLFVPFPVLPIHNSLSILDYTRPPVYVAVLSYLHFFFFFFFLDTFLHYISPVFLGTSHWLIDVRSSRHFISHVTSILIAELNANTCGRPPLFCACLCVCVCVCVCVAGGGALLTTVPE